MKNEKLQDTVGTPLYRWYEHHQQYSDARRILTALIEICRKQRNPINEAVMLNNLGFEYLLEGDWKSAVPYFERSAEMFKENGYMFDYANSRANYWTCRFECDDLVEVEKIETELEKHAEILGVQDSWHARKPFILLAKIEERRMNIDKAIALVDRAIRASKNTNTRYPELDGKYLADLKRKADSST